MKFPVTLEVTIKNARLVDYAKGKESCEFDAMLGDMEISAYLSDVERDELYAQVLQSLLDGEDFSALEDSDLRSVS